MYYQNLEVNFIFGRVSIKFGSQAKTIQSDASNEIFFVLKTLIKLEADSSLHHISSPLFNMLASVCGLVLSIH